MNRLCLLTILALIGVTTVHAQLDKAKLAEEYKAWDLSKNGGLGASEATDSGTLGWSESSYLRGYSNMWLAGGDTYWLAKIQDHFTRIMGSATDPDGDGFLGWQTATYSAAVYWCQPLLNRGTGTIDPPFFSEKNAKAIEQVTGHNYVINFVDAATYRVQDQSTRQWVSEALTYKSGEVITAVPGCKVRISGEARTGDRFMVRTLRPEPTEYAVHEGMLAYPVSVFIEAVAKDPKLREQFGASADSFLQFINLNFLQKHEQDWVEYEDGSGAWRFADLITDRFPNRIMPHNQYLALARTVRHYLMARWLETTRKQRESRSKAVGYLSAEYLLGRQLGNALLATQLNDIAAKAMGVNLTIFKTLSFAVSAFYAGVAGGLYAFVVSFFDPFTFNLILSIIFLVMVVVGGLGSILGAVMGAALITYLQFDLLKNVEELPYLGEFLVLISRKWLTVIGLANFGSIALGLIMLGIVIFEPLGMFGIWIRIKKYWKTWPF